MALVQWTYQRRRRQGTGTKALEQSGDWDKLMQHLIRLSEAHFDYETAAELRAQLNRRPPSVVTDNTTSSGTPSSEPVRIRKRKKKPVPSPSSDQRKLREAWREVDARRGRDV